MHVSRVSKRQFPLAAVVSTCYEFSIEQLITVVLSYPVIYNLLLNVYIIV